MPQNSPLQRKITHTVAFLQDPPTGSDPDGRPRASDVDDEVVLLDRDGEGLGDVRALGQLGAGLDLDRELPRLPGLRIAPGLAGANVELPAVPGAAQELAGARQAI